MITAGIDVGIENAKIIIMQDGKILGRGKNLSGGFKRLEAVEEALADALADAGLEREALERTVSTGKGKFDLPFVDRAVTEPITAAKAARFLCPDVSTSVTVGADETLVLTIKQDNKVGEFVVNEKCAAGLGYFLKYMAMRLGFTLDDMSELPRKEDGGPSVNDGCIVFAELDALSLLNHGVSAREIASAITDAAAVRACMTINDITVPNRECVVLTGGLTKNAAFVAALKAYSGIEFVIPEEAEYAGAIGAALFAADIAS